MDLNALNIINEVHLEALQDYGAQSRYIIDHDYAILNLRFLKQTQDGLANHSVKFLFKNNQIFKVDDNKLNELTGANDLYRVLASIADYEESIIDRYVETLEDFEDQIFDKKQSRSFVMELFELKRDIFKFNRSLERQFLVLSDFINRNSAMLAQKTQDFSELLGSIEINQRLIKTQIEKLDTVYGYYSTLKNDMLNRNIYILSVISGIFLPLNLIVGFFGMNTTGLFLSEHSNGTMIVFQTIVAIFVFLLIGFPLLHLLDKFILYKVFGRFSLYSRLSKRLQNISEDFNILKE